MRPRDEVNWNWEEIDVDNRRSVANLSLKFRATQGDAKRRRDFFEAYDCLSALYQRSRLSLFFSLAGNITIGKSNHRIIVHGIESCVLDETREN